MNSEEKSYSKKYNRKVFFFVSGYIPSIVATVIASKLHKDEKKILVNIQGKNVFKHDRYASPSKGHQKGLFVLHKVGRWDKIINVPQKCLVGPSHEIKIGLLKRIKSFLFFGDLIENVDEITQILAENINIDNRDLIYASDNTIAWRLLKNKFIELDMIEHGTGCSYFDSTNRSFLKNMLKVCIEFFVGLIFNRVAYCKIRRKYITDCKNSSISRYYNNEKLKSKYISLCIKDEVLDLIDNYFLEYKKIYPSEYQELEKIKGKLLNFDHIFVYNPVDVIGLDVYGEFLSAQLNEQGINKNSSFFIIKKHPRDKGEFSAFFDSLGFNSYELAGDINKYLPMEMILYFFDKAILFSSYSSSVVYAKWWLDRDVIFTDIADQSLRSFLRKEYKGVLDIFENV